METTRDPTTKKVADKLTSSKYWSRLGVLKRGLLVQIHVCQGSLYHLRVCGAVVKGNTPALLFRAIFDISISVRGRPLVLCTLSTHRESYLTQPEQVHQQRSWSAAASALPAHPPIPSVSRQPSMQRQSKRHTCNIGRIARNVNSRVLDILDPTVQALVCWTDSNSRGLKVSPLLDFG